MQNRKKRRLPFILTILIMAFIFLQSALPADLSQQESGTIVGILVKLTHMDAEVLSFAVRKCAHFTEYLALGMSTFAAVREHLLEKGGRWGDREHAAAGSFGHTDDDAFPRRLIAGAGSFERTADAAQGAALPAWMIGTLYAVTDEVHQYFVPGRSCEIRDMVIDGCGVAVGVLIMAIIKHRKKWA